MELALEASNPAAVTDCLKQRNSLLAYVVKLKKSIDQAHNDLVGALTTRLTETAIDYLSYGHFKLLADTRPTRAQIAALQVTTDHILEFEERYAPTPSRINLAAVGRDLEALALTLNARFEIEDEILAH